MLLSFETQLPSFTKLTIRLLRQWKVYIQSSSFSLPFGSKLTDTFLRTTLQHYLFKDGQKYLLHPSIPTYKPNIRIAEIGVGTG